ncbi:protein-glutamate O-methyltransferase CheR [Microvirga sp. VF16]|uniref:CheR family methyltransferase n=1 Tax=Microvirga sp. VF16 TaxID=2807101 RepID=UPI00193DA2C2|nr:CheR family methyltransferase [Microvirga sp. VF16]QRM36097.1 hypothetical protein JO965_45905 [Microvirga sp. VF16]
MTGEADCAAFLQWALPQLRLRWAGFRRVHHQVCKRLRWRLRELTLETLDHYRHRLETDPHEWTVLDDLCHVTISRFYRDRQVFDVLGRLILPELAERAFMHARPIRGWCAGCASGEEAFTLKILWDLDVRPGAKPVKLEVIGTDADDAVLRRALNGCFSFGSLKDAPVHWVDAAFERRQQLYCIRPAYREGVAFERHDIRSELPAGIFDLVFCRNIVFLFRGRAAAYGP